MTMAFTKQHFEPIQESLSSSRSKLIEQGASAEAIAAVDTVITGLADMLEQQPGRKQNSPDGWSRGRFDKGRFLSEVGLRKPDTDRG